MARVIHQARQMAHLGLVGDAPQVEMGRVSAYVQGVIKQVEANEKSLVEGVEVRFGHVAFQTATTLTLNGETIYSRNTIIATGSHPAIPPIKGLAETGYLTNEGVFDLNRLPASLLVVGGGPIGAELSQAFARLGTRVTLIQGPEHILPREDPEVSESIANVLRSEGVKILSGARLAHARRQGTTRIVTIRRGEQEEEIEAEEILLAVGRQPNVGDLNLEAAGVRYNSEGIAVDAYLRTGAPNILAIGDVIGGYLFTHVAAYQAGIAVRNALVPISKKRVDYRVVPWCTFTDPEVARVGLTPAEAQRAYPQVRVVKFPYTGIDRAQTEGATTGFIKLALAGKKDE
ncbi:MAG: dihydrolipoyl dehydrogenase family protein, partial [Ktedonobacteraceae bacterium]